MRDFKNMKRQRGRNRGGGGGSGGGKPQQNANRAFDSNGPDNVKIRGHAQHVFEKYQQYARDAFSSGDRVLAENYLQHADHYFRVLRTIQPQRSPSEILGRDVLASGLDIDFEEEFEPGEEGAEAQGEADANGEGRYDVRREGEPASRDGQSRDSQSRDGQSRETQPREGQFRDRNEPRRDGYEPRDRNGEFRQDRYGEGQARSRNDNGGRERNDGQYRDRQEGRDRGERPDAYGSRRDARSVEPRREERPYGRDPREGRFEERRPNERAGGETTGVTDPLPVVAPAAPASTFPLAASEADSSPVLRSEDGGMSEAPAFLQPAAGEDAELRKPRARRRRAPRSFEPSDGEDGAQTSSEVQAEEA